MNTNSWQDNFNKLKACRKELKEKYGVQVTDDEADAVLIGQYAVDTINASEIVE